jgi:DNA-binding GntR family transcriptional regulator
MPTKANTPNATSADLVYRELFNRILMGKFKTESRLKEEDIAAEFEVSRGPVREALRELAQDGLVEISAHRGAVVFPFTADDIEDIFGLRKVLELHALESAISSISLHGLTETRLKVQNGADDNPNPQELTEVDEELHGSIAKASRKRRLIMSLDRMNRLIRPFRLLTLTRPDIAIRQKGEHILLIDALFARDLAAAREILNKHIEFGKVAVLSTLVQGHLL